jgi:hypothetical protein
LPLDAGRAGWYHLGVRRVALLLALAALATAVGAAAARAATGPALTVDAAAAGRHAISPRIYGINFADPALAAEIGQPLDRWGGNDKERYNWKIATSNTGRDYYYENIADCFKAGTTCDALDPAADGAYRPMIERDRADGGTTVMQLPLLGYVAKDDGVIARQDHPFACGFPSTSGPAQDAVDPYDTCGNGLVGGAPVASPPPSRTSTPFGAADAKDWVADLVGRYGTAAHGGVGYYELGNEPNLWDDSHRDVHPLPTTYDELGSKSVATARAVKEADPSAKVIGYSEWGWTNYFCSAKDNTGPGSYGCQATDTDRKAHGGMELAAWYLKQMATASFLTGRRLLDDLDLHYYNQGDPPENATRALWDPTYKDQTWIDEPVRLLSRMQAWIDQNFKGTGISLSEYNMSVDLNDVDSVSATLMEADALGLFARYGVDMAALWSQPAPTTTDRLADAFRLYRDYDGHGARFGDQYLPSTSADAQQLAVYGGRRSGDGTLTVAVINKSTQALTSPLTLGHFTAATGTQVWRWTDRGFTRQPNADATKGPVTLTYPARSMTLVVVPSVPGSDVVKPGGGTPKPPPSKLVATLPRLKSTSATLHGRRLSLVLTCATGQVTCPAKLTLSRGHAKLGTASFSLSAGRKGTVIVKLSTRTARSVRRWGHHGRPVTAKLATGTKTAKKPLRLRGR